jgi:hypothetical protein
MDRNPTSGPSSAAKQAYVIALDSPAAQDVRALLERHLTFANEHSPPYRPSPNSVFMTMTLGHR